MSKTFHSGGRIGDLIYQLWTIKKLGGGILYLSDYHHPNWDLRVAESMRTLLEAQPYIEAVVPVNYNYMKHYEYPIDYDLQKAEDGPNGVTHIAERYARFFGLEFDREPWLEVEPDRIAQVILHIPMRRSCRSRESWEEIMEGLEVCETTMFLVGMEEIRGIEPDSVLQTAQFIAGADVMVGTVSCCHAIAEALGKPRLVEQAADCHNVYPTLVLNGMDAEDVVMEVLEYTGGEL